MKTATPPRRGTEEGAAALEAAIIMSALLLLLAGSFELGRVFWTYNTMQLAVEEAGRQAMVSYRHGPSEDCRAQTQASYCPASSNTPAANCAALRAQRVLSDYQLADISVSASEETTSSTARMTICASYSFDLIAPQLLPSGPFSLVRRITVPLI